MYAVFVSTKSWRGSGRLLLYLQVGIQHIMVYLAHMTTVLQTTFLNAISSM